MHNQPGDFLHSRHDKVLEHRHEGTGEADLYVLTMVYNPIRFRSRWKLYQDFAKRVKEAGAKLCVAEIALHDRDFVIGNDDPVVPDIYLPLVTNSILWQKEAALKLLLARLPLTAKYIGEFDADISLARDDWADEIKQYLQTYDVIQPWSEAVDLGPNHTTTGKHHSFIYSWLHNEQPTPGGGYYQPPCKPSGFNLYHPGFARAWRRSALDQVGGLIDFAPLGAADRHMMAGLIGEIAGDKFWKFHPELTPAYTRRLLQWEHNAKGLHKNIGYMPGMLLHYFHGAKVNRRYVDRWKILVDFKFDPDTDLKYDWQGLPQLIVETPRQIGMRDAFVSYFGARDEDATTI